jgi:mRNA-degrading endonuclease RelE of RelBE toxin-antitoxin system
MDIIPSSKFLREFKKLKKKYPSLLNDVDQLTESLQENPTMGEPLGKDCYKVRMAISSKNKGKSGGARVITCVKIVDDTLYLLFIYDKSEQETVADEEIDAVLKSLGLMP